MAFVVRMFKGLQTRRRLKNLRAAETRDFEIGNPEMVTVMEADGDNSISAPFNRNYEVSDSEFSIDKLKVLGVSEFSTVYCGTFREMHVAVKTMKTISTADLDNFNSFVREIKIMTVIEKHPNVLQLLGASTKRIDQRIIYAIFELGVHGNLHSFLKEHESNFMDTLYASQLFNVCTERINSPDYENLPVKPTVTTRDLVKWCGQIAAGMSHLASKKIVHGNLTAKNILVFDDYTVKIGGFGLARKLDNSDFPDYTMGQQAPISWRIMAPESLKYLRFSTKSDTWAFGVLAWEIFSLAELPYFGFNRMLEIMNNLDQGFRLQKPKWASNEIYENMCHCWQKEPEDRPEFHHLEKFYKNIIFQSCPQSSPKFE